MDELAATSGRQRTLLGAVLLGGITSLPEVATVTTSAVVGGSSFAVGTVLGSMAINFAILGAADVVVRNRAALDEREREAVQRQAGLLVVLFGATLLAIVTGEPFQLPVGMWSVAIFLLVLVSFWVLQQAESGQGSAEGAERSTRTASPQSKGRVVAELVVPAALILLAGYAVAQAGTVVAEQTGLSGGFVGFALLAVTTSLPELSTTVSALRLGRASLAFSNVLGTNIFNHALFLVGDLAAGGGALFASAQTSAAAAGLVSVVLLGIYLASLASPATFVPGGVAVHSVLVLAAYLAGSVVVYLAQ